MDRRRIGHRLRGLLAGVCACLVACQQVQVGSQPGVGPEATPVPLPVALAFSPGVATPGSSFSATVSTVSAPLSASSELDLGEGVRREALSVLSPSELRVRLAVDADAALGWRDLVVTSEGERLVLEKALLIQQGSFTLAPAIGVRGQTVDVELTTHGIPMTAGYTWASFGEGITTLGFNPTGEDSAVARILIDSDAPVGLRDVSVDNGPSRVLLPEGFEVDRGVIAIHFEPREVFQGEEQIEFTVTGYNTHFEQGKTTLDLGLGLLIDPEDPEALVVVSPTEIKGKMTVCRAAVVGLHDAEVTTLYEDGRAEIVRDPGALGVIEVPVSADEVRGSFYLGLYRTIREGVEQTAVSASASFTVYPGACGQSNGSFCSAQPPPFDTPVLYPPPGCTPVGNTTQFPPSPNVDAGEFIYFGIPDTGPIIRLAREEDTDGTFFYAPEYEIPLKDFVFGAAYDVWSDGGTQDVAVPAFHVQNVLLTPPADFRVVEPDLAWAPALPPFDAIPMTWVDPAGQPGAHTFPVAFMYALLHTNDAVTGAASEVRVIPFDDGTYTFPADLVSQLYPGPGRLLLSVSRLGPTFTLPGSMYTSNASTGVVWEGLFELRKP